MRKAKPKRIKRILRPLPKATVKRKVRRNPYSVALEKATAKYAKAVLDYQKILLKKEELELALPRLERMKLALEEFLRGGGVGPRPDLNDPPPPPVNPGITGTDMAEAVAILNQPLPERRPTGPAPRQISVPAHLAHMIKQHPLLDKNSQAQGRATSASLPSVGDDDFLPDVTDGRELLPTDHKVIIEE